MMMKGTHKTLTIKIDTWRELMRIKYARGFHTVEDVIVDLLDDELVINNEVLGGGRDVE